MVVEILILSVTLSRSRSHSLVLSPILCLSVFAPQTARPAGILLALAPVPLSRGSTVDGDGRGGFVDMFPSRTVQWFLPSPSRADPLSASTGGIGSGDLFLSRSDPVVSHADPPPATTGGSGSNGVHRGRGLPAAATSTRAGRTPPLPSPSPPPLPPAAPSPAPTLSELDKHRLVLTRTSSQI